MDEYRSSYVKIDQSDSFLQFLRQNKFKDPSLSAKVDIEGKAIFSSNNVYHISEGKSWQLSQEISQIEPDCSYSIFGDINRVFYLINVSKENHFAFFGAVTYGSYTGVTERDVRAVNYLIETHEKLLNKPKNLKENEWFVVTCKDPSDEFPAEGHVVVPKSKNK